MAARISQFFVLSPRGDKIITKDYRHDIVRNSDETFFRRYKFWDPKSATTTTTGGVEAPPFFVVDGVNYCYAKRNNLLFVCTTRMNCSPSLIAELLVRVTKLLKDYLGVLTEESIRKNFVLVYEILDEVIDFGYVQDTSTEKLKAFIFNENVPVENVATASGDGWKNRVMTGQIGQPKTKKHTDSNMSVMQEGQRKNEIFVDVLEKLNVVFQPNGTVVNSVIDGGIIMKSFLAGNPELRLGLNEDLVVGRREARAYSTVSLDDCNFHECVDYDNFEMERTLSFHPPDGEFSVMNYRVTAPDAEMPFKITPIIDQISPYKLEVTLKIRADIPARSHGANTVVKFNVPKTTTNVTVEFGVGAVGQSYEYQQSEKTVVWGIKKFQGATEQMMKARISLASPLGGNYKKEIGPISMQFEVPNHNVSGLAIRFLKIEERTKSYNPSRWVRNITQAHSYICRCA